MKRLITRILCGALFACFLASAANSQTPMPQNGAYFEGQGSYSGGYGGNTGGFRTQMPGTSLEHLYFGFTGVDQGLGFEGSYFTVGSLMPFTHDDWDGTWYSDNRAHISENGNFFGNFGIGRRQNIAGTVHGLGLWYSVDDDQWDNFGHTFHELAGTLEILDPNYEVRLNGYLPISNTDFNFGSSQVPFVGHLLLIQPGYDVALSGLDAEAGLAVAGMEQWAAKIFAGYYFYDALEPSFPLDGFGGVRGRLEFSPHPKISVNLLVNHDDTFKTTGFLNVSWHPWGGRHPAESSLTLQPARRNDHIVRRHMDPIVATDPDTGLPYRFLHVNNWSPAGGVGTLEAPFRTFAEAEAASSMDDVLYVHGDTGLAYTEMYTLKDRQFFFGSGPGLVTIPTVEVGDFALPSITDNAPVLANATGPSVTLANDNTVGRIDFNGGMYGVMGTGIQNPTITTNTFQNNNIGLLLANVGGTTRISNNLFDGAFLDGARITNSTGPFLIDGNEFNNNVVNGIFLFGNTGLASFTGNSFGNNAQVPMSNLNGLHVVSTGGTSNVLISGNVFAANLSAGALLESRNVGTVLNVTSTNNLYIRNIGDAVRLIANNGSTLNGFVLNELLVSNGTGGAGTAVRGIATNPLGLPTTSVLNLLVDSSFVDVGAGGDGTSSGVSLRDFGNSNYFAVIQNSTISNPTGQGTAGYGIFGAFGSGSGAASTILVDNVLVDGAAGGMQFTAGTLGAVHVRNSVSQNNAAEGMIALSASGILDILIDNSSFSNNGTDGVNVASSNTGTLVFTANNSLFNNNGDHGFELHASPTIPFVFAFFDGNSFSGNGGPQDFLAQVDVGGNPPLHAGTQLCLSFTQNVATSNYVLNNNANNMLMPIPEVATILFENDGTNIPGFTTGGPSPVIQVAFGTCAAAAAPFRLQ